MIDNFQKVPMPPLGESDNYIRIAQLHYASGYHAFLGTMTSRTALQRFDNAIQLQPDSPSLLVLPGIDIQNAWEDDERAQCDALFAVYLEKERGWSYSHRRQLALAFFPYTRHLAGRGLNPTVLVTQATVCSRSAVEGNPATGNLAP